MDKNLFEELLKLAENSGQRNALYKAMHELNNVRLSITITKIGAGIVVALIIGGFGVGYLSRNYDVWAQGMLGKAKLAEATQSRQIAIEGAKAKQESATFEAEAEVRRAKGVAEANKIIGKSLQGNESYLRYLWVNQLSENNQNVIYIPTEANMPIMEAGKRK